MHSGQGYRCCVPSLLLATQGGGYTASMDPASARLGVYIELPYKRDVDGYSADRAFMLFVLAVGERFGRVKLIGRVDPQPGRAPYAIPAPVTVSPLPYYPSLRDVRDVVASIPATARAIWRSVDDVDVIWVLGPHPFSIPVALVAKARGRRVVLGVRQNFPQYVAHRLPSGRWRPAVLAAHLLEGTFRLLARRLPVTAVGADLTARYRRGGAAVLEFVPSLVPQSAPTLALNGLRWTADRSNCSRWGGSIPRRRRTS